MRRIIVVALAAIALMAVVVSLATRSDDATPTTPATVEIPRDEVTRADTRVVRPTVAPAGTIQGTVVLGDDRTPDDGRLVELVQGDAVVARATTDGIGEFAFRAVAPHQQHELRVASAGCRTVRVTGLTLLPNECRDVGRLVLDEPRVIRVTVTDERGTPIPDAAVDLFREPPGAMAQNAAGTAIPPPVPVQTLRVDEKGEGELHLGYGARHAIVAHAPGYANAALAQVEIALVDAREERLRLVLWTPVVLTGVVVDSAGTPVPGASVLTRPPPRHWGSHGERALSTAVWQITTADDAGAFRLDTLAPGPVEIQCAREGELPSGARVLQVPEIGDVRLVLPEQATIEGTARTVDGEPLAGVTVRTSNDASSQVAVTGADGRWSTPGLPAGEIVHVDLVPPAGWLGPREPGNALQPSGVIGGWYQKRLGAGQRLTLDVTFERAAIVTGRVSLDGAPEPRAWVRAVTLADGTRRARADSTRADERGIYRLTAVTPGRVVVQALPASVHSDDTWSAFRESWEQRFAEDGAAEAAAVAVTAAGTTRIDIDAAMPDGMEEKLARRAELRARMDADDDGEWTVRIVGNVTTADGVPLREAIVTADIGPASEARGGDPFYGWKTVHVGADGRFDGTVKVFGDPTTVHVIATDARHGTVRKDASPVESDGVRTFRCDIELPVIPTLSGRVVHDGGAVANADVRVDGAILARTAEDGSFEIPFPRNGWLFIRADGYLDARHILDDVDPVVIELAPSGSLAGIVTDDSGRPVAGIRVLPVDGDDDPIDGYAEWEYFASRPVPVTRADGRFRVEHVPTRGVYLRISSADSDALATAPFTAGPFDASDGDVEVVVRKTRRLGGRVVGPDGEPVEDVRIRCVPDAPGAATASTSTDADGGFSLTALQSCRYQVAAVPPHDSEFQPAAAEVSADQEHVEIALTRSVFITGTAHWRDGSSFRPALRLQPLDPVPDALAGQDLRFDPEDDGTFRVAATGGMRYAIEVYLRDWQGSVTLAGGESVLAGATGIVITATHNVDGIDPEARSAGTVGGTIVTTGGAAVAGADVLVFPSAGSAERTTTDAEGRFSVTGLDAAATTASVAVFADGRCSTQIDDVKIGKTDVRIALSSARTISGLLLTADGAPATGYRIRAWRTANPIHDLWRADVDADGAFVLTGVARGTWTLEAIVERRDGIHEVVTLGIVKGGAKNLELRLP